MSIKIGVYTVAKNEIKHCERFMRFCKDADGVFILDTGSTDGTPSKLRTLGATVKDEAYAPWSTLEEYDRIVANGGQPWRFDRARNLNLEMVPKNYDVCFCLDLDEVPIPNWRHIIEQLWTPGKTTHMSYRFAWSMKSPPPADNNELYKRLSQKVDAHQPFYYHKIHSRKGYKWVAPVHEGFVLTPDLKEERFVNYPGVLVCHYPDGTKSRGSYLPMLALGVREDPKDARIRFYYCRELAAYSKWADLITNAETFLGLPNTNSFERCHACMMLSRAYNSLGDKKKALSWSMRAATEEPGQREPWVALAEYLRLEQNYAGGYWAAKQAIGIPKTAYAYLYLNNPDDWEAKPHCSAGASAFYAGLTKEAFEENWLALEKNPWDQLLINNYALTQDLRIPEPPAPVEPLVDVIILAYSKDKEHYDMTCKCIRSLRRSSPDVPMNVIVVETNTDLQEEPFAADPLFGPYVQVVFPGRPFGYNDFLNEGAAKFSTSAHHALLLNNDVVLFRQNFIREMLKGLECAASVSPVGVREATWGLVDFNKPVDFGFDINKHLSGWAIMFDKAILSYTSFNELFPRELSWAHQETYYGSQLKRRGLKHALVTAARALHLQRQSHTLREGFIKPPENRDEMLDRLEIKDGVCAEIGVFEGTYSLQILSRNPKSLLLVDPWLNQPESVYKDGCNVAQNVMDNLCNSVAIKFKADNRVSIKRAMSLDAAVEAADASLDFVYVDGNHSKAAVYADLEAWLPKVKTGKYLAGHDFQLLDVQEAVHEFLKKHPEVHMLFVTPEAIPSWALQVGTT